MRQRQGDGSRTTQIENIKRQSLHYERHQKDYGDQYRDATEDREVCVEGKMCEFNKERRSIIRI